MSFSGEAGHFVDDRFFLTAIKTQGLLLQMHMQGKPCIHALVAATNCLGKISICSGIAICVGLRD
ncbi:hypothetical protein APV28_2432 [Comamonas testosteroni]|nr:hypothetical protein APV28_2432 [Comamonas testosteroni]